MLWRNPVATLFLAAALFSLGFNGPSWGQEGEEGSEPVQGEISSQSDDPHLNILVVDVARVASLVGRPWLVVPVTADVAALDVAVVLLAAVAPVV